MCRHTYHTTNVHTSGLCVVRIRWELTLYSRVRPFRTVGPIVHLYICTFVHLYISSLPCREVPSSRTLCYGRIPLLLRKLLSYNRCRFCTALHKKTNFGYSFFIFKDRKNCGSVFFIFKDGKNFLNGFSFCFYEIPPQFRIKLYGTVFSVQFFSKLGRP